MNIKDTITAVFMFLTMFTYIAIASILTETRDMVSESRDGINCMAYDRALMPGCDESVNIGVSAPKISNDMLTVY